MISNSTPYKLKASKSSRVLQDYKTNQEEAPDSDSVEGDGNHNADSFSSSWDGRYKPINRSRHTEFRPSRIVDRRGSYRGRGGSVGSRRGRDYLERGNYVSKYSPTRPSEASSGYHSKHYETDKKSDLKVNLPEDTRISKLLRRLSIEGDQENSLTISKKLLEVLLIPDNAAYVRKAFHILGESMYDILCVSPGPLAKEQAARALGRMGYIMAQENDFQRYEDWFFNKMQNANDDIRYLFMKSLKETFIFERKHQKLHEYASELMHDLISIIEITDNPEIFKATLDNLMTLVEIYPEHIYAQFSNTIDLLFGWHVDPTQPLSNIEFVSKNLQRMAKHFQVNLDFSITLIWHFIEDIETYSANLHKAETEENEVGSTEQVTVFVLALNTVLRCLGETFHPANTTQVTCTFVSDCLQQILKTASDALQFCVPDNLIIAANDSISLLLGALGTKTGSLNNSIYSLIDQQLSLINDFNDSTIISMLLMISKVIKELSSDLPIDLIEKLIGPRSEIIRLRYSPFINVQDACICLYQSLLNLKNIPLLQEAYKLVLCDLEIVYQKILPDVHISVQNDLFKDVEVKLNQEDVELTVLFLLRCLSQLANSSGSIIGMWALKPSILELLGIQLEPYNNLLTHNAPTLQYSVLYLLYSHCKCYNHFISSSSLVASKQDKIISMRQLGLPESMTIVDVATNSPNSGNFGLILEILNKSLSIRTTDESTLLLMHWLSDILLNSEAYLEVLYNNEKFTPLTKVLVKCGYSFNLRVVLAVCDNLEKLLSNKHLSWSNNFLVSVTDLCKLHMDSTNEEVRLKYTSLSANIPWDIAIVEFNKLYGIEQVKHRHRNLNHYNNCTVTMAQHLHLTGSFYGEMQALQFKTFMKYLLDNQDPGDNWLEDLFTCCWPLEADNQANAEEFRDLALNSRAILHTWATFEAAQFCVNSKLRTPLGKPTDTFTTIEAALKHVARELIRMKNEGNKTEVNKGADQKRVRLLLQFMEHLEKTMYNASEGCAIALPQPSKPVRVFFHTNASTCKEWLCRIRSVLTDLALHAGDPAVALRHGQSHLKELLAAEKANGVDFQRTVMQVTLAYLVLQESEPITGLYMWCKKVAGKKYSWIKCAADQANKRYETAAAGYKNILENINQSNKKSSEETDGAEEKETDMYVQHFIADQIITCYKELNNHIDLMHFHTEDQYSVKPGDNGVRYSFGAVDWECTSALFNAEIGNYAFNELTSWQNCGTERSWSVYDTQCSTEANLYNIALNISSVESNKLREAVDSNLGTIYTALQDNLMNLASGFTQNFCLMHYVVNGFNCVFNNVPANTVFLVSDNFDKEIRKIDSRVLNKILWWSEYFGKVQNQETNTFSNNLRLDIIKKARKEKNFSLACGNICKFFNDKNLFNDSDNGNQQQLVLPDIATLLLSKLPETNIWSLDIARAVTEVIKLCYSNEDSHQMTFNLCATASTAISKYAELYGGNELRMISSKILLKLATWLQANDSISLTELGSPLGKLLMVLPEIGIVENTDSTTIPMNDMAVGKLLHFSVNQCVGLAKSWNAFGTWCYRWGRKIVDRGGYPTTSLSDDDQLVIKNLLPPETTSEDLTKITSILSQSRAVMDDEDIDANEINTSEMIQSQLQNVPCLHDAPESLLENLVQIWKSVQMRVYVYYELSAQSYFKYLELSTSADNITKSTECNTTIVTLRLLRLIVKHALELQNVLEEGLATTPTHPWKVIIPQLFSRLNHPESYVRRRVSELLCRVAEDAPHLITFPAVVGALEGGVKFDFSEITLPKDCLSQNNVPQDDTDLNEIYDNYDSDNEDNKNVLQSCFKSMVETLSKQAPEMITQVQMLVKELRRITLLWDELWLGTLAQHHSEIIKRQQQLEQEIEKVNANPNLEKEEKVSLIAEKHRIIIKPIIFVLEQLNDVTSVEPETPHEKQFQERYAAVIKEVLEKLKNPEHPEKPQESWQPLKALQKIFQQKFHKRSSYTLKMEDISPTLASIKDTVIAMPGLATSAKVRVTVSSVSNHVSILPTKTKPKKLMFHGSNGQTYTYLFKGLEDLHLDERIMQFLSIANTMMAQSADSHGHNLYKARHYSVIPLGPRSGLIRWVDGTTPVFALYKRWQQREAAKLNGKSSVNLNTQVLRPSELFYNKLNPLLKEHGVKNIENRKEWPLSILKRVLTELMAETPSDLLARELWCHSINAANYWQIVKKYSYSVAVMSIIGYIIGLGDRHLDNVLVDLTTGEVVHIDYNVCFEKGKTLRVPEKVPFRMTQNLRDALGLTGIEGIFRLACENVLKIMKKGRETLLTLLEAFVYDPLVDWTVGNEVLAGTSFGGIAGNNPTRQTRKDLEREVTLSMFNVRCTEIKADWNANKEDLLQEIPPLIENFQLSKVLHKTVTDTEDYLKDLHQQMALLKEAEAHGAGNHPLYSLPARYESFRKAKDAVNKVMSDFDSLTTECEQHLQRYVTALKAIGGPQCSQWYRDLNMNVDHDSFKVFDLVKEFLQNAGQNAMIEQCEQSENDVLQLAQQQNICARKCLQFLQEYNTILTQCPASLMEQHRMYLIPKWSKYIQEVQNITACDVVYNQFQAFLELRKTPLKSVIEFSYRLSLLYTDAVKLLEELAKLRSPETMSTYERMYNSAQMGISTFLAREKGAATKALEFVIVSELLLLNQNFLTLETAAHRSGDWLIKLTSRDGDWFLDELVLNSNRAVELVNNIPVQQNRKDDTRFSQVLSGVRIANNLYKGLQELNCNFHKIIVPEGLKKIQSEEPSVIQAIAEFNSIILSVGVPLHELILQLEKMIPCVLMQLDVSPTQDTVKKVAELRTKFTAFMQVQQEMRTEGQMLLVGFNGLFDKLTQELDSLVSTMSNIEVPSSWRKLDQVKEAKGIAAHVFHPEIKPVLDDIFLLKKLITMTEFITLCVEMSQSFKGIGNTIIYNDEQLVKPIRQFIADFISRQFLGITTEAIAYTICFLLQHLGVDVSNEIEQKDIGAENKVPLDELYQKCWSLFLKRGTFTQNILAQASSLETNLKAAWEKIQGPKKIEQNFSILQASVTRIQQQLTAHYFVFEDILAQHPISSVLLTTCTLIRGKFILDLGKEVANLRVLQCKLTEAREQQNTLITSAVQRLKWAAGANPDLNEILSAFDCAVKARDNHLNLEQQITNVICSTSNTLLSHELFRTQAPDVQALDKKFINYCEQWKAACQFSSKQVVAVAPTEESIMKLLTPECVKSTKWVEIVSEKISDLITSTQKELSDQKAQAVGMSEDLLKGIDNLSKLYSKHCKLVNEVKSLIKSMAKIEDFGLQTQQFITEYREYVEKLAAAVHISKDMDDSKIEQYINNLKYVEEHTEAIYKNFMELEVKKNGRTQLVRQDGFCKESDKTLPMKQESTTKGQQRNAYAVSVWRRVRMKLEGRDPDPGKKYTVQEQVDYIIQEATSLDNLALLYEGWTPWV